MKMNRIDAVKLQKSFEYLRNKGLIKRAEGVYVNRPDWFVKKLNRLENKIKRSAIRGKSVMHFFTPFFSGIGFLMSTRLALCIALCDKGYYVSIDNMGVYISWSWPHEGVLKLSETLARRPGGVWNTKDAEIANVYNILIEERSSNA